MKRTYFACLFLCLTTTFLLAQFAAGPNMPTALRGARRLHGAFPLPEQEQFAPGGLPRGVPLLPRGRARAASHGNFVRGMLQAPDSASNPVFLAAPTYGSGGEFARSVAVADVNGDGKPDLIVVNEFASNFGEIGSVGVLLGNGDGTFQSAVTYGYNGDQASSVVVADVNGDGKPDILVGIACATIPDCDNGGVGVLLGNGDGTFQPAVTYSSGEYDAQSLAVADVNGDGKLDLLVTYYCVLSNCTYTHGGVAVLLGNGDGSFQPAVTYDSGAYGTTSVVVADVNGDGKPDVLVANECPFGSSGGGCEIGSVGVLLGNGNGTFQPAVSSYNGVGPSFIAVADLNGDGKPDLLVGTCGSPSNCGNGEVEVAVLLGNGNGTFQAAVTYGSGGQYVDSLTVADVNGDGKLDLLVTNECVSSGNCDDGGVAVLLGNGDGTFQPALAYDSGGNDATSVAVGDVNGDGKPDVLVVNECVGSVDCANGEVAVLLGRGNGTFQAAVNYSSGGYDATSIAVGDVNGDSKLDLLVASECFTSACDYGSLGVLLGNGDGTLQSALAYNSGGYDATSVAVGDVNGDGKLDLLVANLCANSTNCGNFATNPIGIVGVLLGNGDGTFQPAVTYDSGAANTTSVAVGDVNGDGKLDLLVANGCFSSYNCGNGSVGVLLGNGDGTFQPAVTYGSGGYGVTSVVVRDVNGDGKLDLLVANEFAAGNQVNGSVGVLLGNGDGTFQPAVTYSSGGQNAFSVVVGDVNGDGKPDVLVANECVIGNNCSNSENGSVGVLLGNGDGTFQSAVTLVTSGQNSGALALADFNGDGKLDVASGAGGVLLLGNGDGTFQPPLALGAFGPGIAVGDLNRDGKPDLAVGGVTVLLNVSPIAPTTTALVSSLNPSRFDQRVTFTATVSSLSGRAPTGKVTFMNGATVLVTKALSCGKASFTTSNLPAGLNSITAVYGGNSKFGVSTSVPVNQFVLAATTTTVKSSPNPSAYGQTVVFTATVRSSIGAPPDGETVTFKQGATILGTGTLSGGTATFSISTLGVGTKSVTSVYGGDSNFAASKSKAVSQVVSKATTTTTLTSSLNPSNYGKSVIFTARVTPQFSGTPTGSIVYKDGTTTLKTVSLSGGVAKFTTKTLASGTHTITATYNGSTSFDGSSASLTQTVD